MYFKNAWVGKNQFWRWLVSFFTIFFSWQGIGAIPLTIVILIYAPWGDYLSGDFNIKDFDMMELMNFENMGINLNLGFFLLFFSFVIGLIGLLICIRYFHRKPVRAVITGRSKIDWKRFFTGAMIWGGLMGVVLVVELQIYPERFEFNFDAANFFPLLIIAIIMVPIQTSFEEIWFRGYWMQGFAMVFKNRWMPLIITSVIFGLLHSANPEVAEYGFFYAMPQYILFGLFFGLIVILDNGLELSMGVHAANNLFVALFTTSSTAAFQTPAIFEVNKYDPSLELCVFIGMILLFLGIAAAIYKWKNWGILFQKIVPPAVEEVVSGKNESPVSEGVA